MGAELLLLGNKCDANSDSRKVSKEEAEQIAKNYGAYFAETSAKDNLNIHVPFEEILRRALNQVKPSELSRSTSCTTIVENVVLRKTSISRKLRNGGKQRIKRLSLKLR